VPPTHQNLRLYASSDKLPGWLFLELLKLQVFPLDVRKKKSGESHREFPMLNVQRRTLDVVLDI
jgi:hypothetical protein